MERVQAIRERINRDLGTELIEIIDESHLHIGHAGAAAGGGHFAVKVISDKFSNRSILERHRMIYQAVDDLMPSEIHALSIQALTPEEQ